jgi:putative ABC transport system substrate-binding protein
MAGISAAAVVGCSPSSARKLRRIGWLSGNANTPSVKNLSQPFFQELSDLGYVEGRDFEPVLRIADTDITQLPDMAAELVAMPVDILIAEAQAAQTAAKGATKTIPIVFVLASDPVGQGLVATLSHPGGNITGVTSGTLLASGKNVERLKQAWPSLSSIAVLWNANSPSMRSTLVLATENAARTLHMQPRPFGVRTEAELIAALDIVAREGLESLVLLPALSVIREKFGLVPDLAARIKIPQAYADAEIVRNGAGLMSFNSNRAAQSRRAAALVDKIFNGTRPQDIPVEEPTQYDFILNRIAAQRIDLTFPASILGLADEVIG